MKGDGMKSRSEIWLATLAELGEQCSVSTQRDAETAIARATAEGDTFFKVTLPKFAKDFEQSLAYEAIPSWAFHGFSQRPLYVKVLDMRGDLYCDLRRIPNGVPKFLGGFLDLLFASEQEVNELDLQFYSEGSDTRALRPRLKQPLGTLTVERQADAVHAIRQLCLMFGKEKELCSPQITEAAYTAFTQTDKELDTPLWTSGPTPSFEEVCSLMFGGVSESFSGLPSASSMEQSIEDR